MRKLKSLTPKAPTLGVDILGRRKEGAEVGEELGEDLSPIEKNIEIGLTKDKIRYIAEYLAYENPNVPIKNIYSAVGAALKRYSFRSVLLASKTVRKLDERTLFPRFIYACKSFYATETSRVDETKVVESLQRREDSSKLRDMLKRPYDTMLDMLFDEKITKEQFEEVKDSQDGCKALIREVVMHGSTGAT